MRKNTAHKIYKGLTATQTMIVILMIMALTIFTTGIVVTIVSAQDSPKALKVKTWRMPDYMVENLRNMLEKFNREFEEKIKSYKAELRKRFEEFGDMPEDVVFDLESGVLIGRDDFIALQKRQAEVAAKIKKDTEGKK